MKNNNKESNTCNVHKSQKNELIKQCIKHLHSISFTNRAKQEITDNNYTYLYRLLMLVIIFVPKPIVCSNFTETWHRVYGIRVISDKPCHLWYFLKYHLVIL